MSERYYVEPASELRFDWVYRQFERIQQMSSLLSDGHVYKFYSHEYSDGATLSIGEFDEYLVYLIDPTSGTVTVELPSIDSLNGRMIYIKNTATAATVKYVAIDPDGTDKIDRRQVNQAPSSATLNIDRLTSLQLLSDGPTNTWWVI